MPCVNCLPGFKGRYFIAWVYHRCNSESISYIMASASWCSVVGMILDRSLAWRAKRIDDRVMRRGIRHNQFPHLPVLWRFDPLSLWYLVIILRQDGIIPHS